MTNIIFTKPQLLYTENPLDRVAALRKHPDFVLKHLIHPKTRLVIYWQGQHLLAHIDSPEMMLYIPARKDTLLSADQLQTYPWVLLGMKGDVAYLAIDLSYEDSPDNLFATPHVSFGDVRHRAAFLSIEEGALAAQSRAMLHWLATHKFCGHCGGKNVSHEGGYKLACTQNADHIHFPRTDPAVMMLIEHEDACLLAQPVRTPPQANRFATLAGFVEPGEQLEEAVHREAFEETGLMLKNISYVNSQPWPYPSSLMVGFTAIATDRELKIDHSELAQAQWFTRKTLQQKIESHSLSLPAKNSLSRYIIDEWLYRKR